MSSYTQQEEVEIVRDAMSLTTAIKIEREELARQKAAKFRAMPTAPFQQVLEVPTVPVRLPSPPRSKDTFLQFLKRNFTADQASAVRFLVLCFLTCNIYMWVYLYGAYQRYSAEKKAQNYAYATSEAHVQAVAAARQQAQEEQQRVKDETARRQLEIDAQYETDLAHYQTVLLPDYNAALARWKEIQQKKITMLEEDLQLHEDTLAALYDSTKLVSLTYRELWILRWLYDDMRTSDHDIRYATELLDRDRQRYATMLSGRMVTDAVNSMHASMMEGFGAVYNAIEEGNAELVRMRREQNLANLTGITQRHNLNKMMKKQNTMLDERFHPKK